MEMIVVYFNHYTGMGRPLGHQEFEAPRISRQSANKHGKNESPTHRSLYSQKTPLALIPVRG
jgi:hypothetical protein